MGKPLALDDTLNPLQATWDQGVPRSHN